MSVFASSHLTIWVPEDAGLIQRAWKVKWHGPACPLTVKERAELYKKRENELEMSEKTLSSLKMGNWWSFLLAPRTTSAESTLAKISLSRQRPTEWEGGHRTFPQLPALPSLSLGRLPKAFVIYKLPDERGPFERGSGKCGQDTHTPLREAKTFSV